jgi:hypothetical protein
MGEGEATGINIEILPPREKVGLGRGAYCVRIEPPGSSNRLNPKSGWVEEHTVYGLNRQGLQ